MRERIELYGGMVRSGPRAGGGYEVIARLPMSTEAA
jgi:signal transduction histidine kinase